MLAPGVSIVEQKQITFDLAVGVLEGSLASLPRRQRPILMAPANQAGAVTQRTEMSRRTLHREEG
jgi:hypothetical protein